ncbi:MAG: Hint domain-containing protein [Pseudomonadota bacterium]
MVASLNGIIFSQIYPDNSGGPEFDTDGDGTATQEDEFVAILNNSATAVDISGWQIWSDSTGSGAPDSPQDGLYHTFPADTILQPGQELFVINEITDTLGSWAQEASEGGVESGSGSPNTNFLTEGNGGGAPESIVLVDPVSGEFIVFNMSPNDSNVPNQQGFPGTVSVGEVDGNSVQEDPTAGESYQFDASTGNYEYEDVVVPCFVDGTMIAVPDGEVPVEDLAVGDLVETLDHGPQPIRMILHRELHFGGRVDAKHKPVEFKPGSLGPNLPVRTLRVSPQHRMLIVRDDGQEWLAPARGLTDLPGVRVMISRRRVTYIQLVFDQHEVVRSDGAWTESFYPGAYVTNACDAATKRELQSVFPGIEANERPSPARPLARVRQAREMVRQA